MIRRHLVAVLGVVLGVAVGIALGAGPLTGAVADRVDPELATGPAPEATATPDRLADAVLDAAGATLYGDGLDGAEVAVLAAPGADAEEVATVEEQVAAAGGRVSGSWSLGETLVAPSEKTLVDTLGQQLTEQIPQAGIDSAVPTYERLGALLGRAVATQAKSGEPGDRAAASIAASLGAADLATGGATEEAGSAAPRRAPYVVLVLPADPGAEGDPIVAGLVAGLAGQAHGVLVQAPAADAALERLRSATAQDGSWPDVTTVDGTGQAAAVTSVLALTRWRDTRGQAFGVAGADGAVPMD